MKAKVSLAVAAFCVAAGWTGAAPAQTYAQVVASCPATGIYSSKIGTSQPFVQDQNGNRCGTNSGGAGASAAAPSFTAPATGSCTDTTKSVTTSSATLLPAGTYKSVTFENLTTATNVTFQEGSTATVGQGMVLQGPAASGGQGGLYSYSVPPTNAVSAVGSAAATVIVKTCN